jgi:O-antigen ligase
VNRLSPLFSPLFSAPPALRFAAAFAVLAVLAVGLPHAFISNALILALAGVVISSIMRRTRNPAAQGLDNTDADGKVLATLVIAWVVWVIVRALLGLAWREPPSWSGLGHALALGVPFVLAAALRAPLARVGDVAIGVGLCGVAVLALLNALLPGNTLRLFAGYRVYLGNDSIAIDMLLTLLASGAILAFLAQWLRTRVEPPLWHAIAVVVAVLPLVVFAQSRSALVVFLLSVGLGAIVVARTWLQRILVPAAVLGLVVAAYVVSPLARDRMEKAVAEVSAAISEHYVATSQGQRLALASVSWHTVKDRPIVGHGLGTWRTEFAKRVPPQWQSAIGQHTSPHNEYMHIATQLGAIGVLIYVGIWLLLLRMGVQQLRRRASPWLFLISVAFLVGSITNVMLWDFRFWAPFSALLTCALASAQSTPETT